LIKMFAFISLFILLRASLPRPRYDQLMSLGWKVMLPLSLVNIIVTAGFLLLQR
jgi:NADH-quinone oxidoreductase subunit H